MTQAQYRVLNRRLGRNQIQDFLNMKRMMINERNSASCLYNAVAIPIMPRLRASVNPCNSVVLIA
jgi:hypothetical protein